MLLATTLALLVSAPPPRSCQSLAEGNAVDAPDSAAARKCFEAQQDWLALAVLAASEGGQDVEALLARFVAAKVKLPGWARFEGDDDEAVKQVLEGVRTLAKEPPQPGRGFERLCAQVARTTPGMGACASESRRLDQEAAARQLRAWSAGLSPAQRKHLDALSAAFEKLKKADSARVYKRYEGGTIRGLAALSQEELLLSAHVDHLGRVFSKHAFKPADAAAFAAADKALNAAYRALPTEERAEAKAAQRSWIAYRDAFEALARSLAGDDAGMAELLPLRARLTRWRTYELELDPVQDEGLEKPD